MARTFQKVHKHVNKKKGAVEALHENSRDAKRLRRAGARDDRVSRVQASLARGRDLFGMLRQSGIFPRPMHADLVLSGTCHPLPGEPPK